MGYGIKRVTKRLGTAALLPLIAFAAVIAASALSATPAVALDGEEQAFLGLINQYRDQHGLGGLSLDGQLTDPSKWLSQAMCARTYCSTTASPARAKSAVSVGRRPRRLRHRHPLRRPHLLLRPRRLPRLILLPRRHPNLPRCPLRRRHPHPPPCQSPARCRSSRRSSRGGNA